MRICTIVGARPQFIKASVVSRALAEVGVEEVIVHTGQHYDESMSQAFFDELDMPEPATNLNVGSGSHATQTAGMLTGIASFLASAHYDGVLIYGDTNSTLAGVLAATKLHLPVFHVEAGLRSGVRTMPEELNRIVADRLSTLLFCPTSESVANLKREGITDGVHLVGDVMLEAIRYAAARPVDLEQSLGAGVSKSFYVATVHRASNVDNVDRLKEILRALGQIDSPVVFPIHPRTAAKIDAASLELPPNIVAVPPVGYTLMANLVANATAVLTDSGGLQKEAYWLETPCITLRDETEWSETLSGNWNQLVGWRESRIMEALTKKPEGSPKIADDGNASSNIAAVLIDYFAGSS